MIVRRFNCTISTSSRLSQSAWMFATVRRVAASIGGGSSSFFPMVPCLAPRAELAWRRLSYWRDGCALSTRGWKRLPGSGGAESCRCAAALWREAARCERLRAVTTRLHDGTIAQGPTRAASQVLPSVLLTASSMPALHPCFAGVQLSFQSQRWERNALRCPCFVAKRCSRRATPRASSS